MRTTWMEKIAILPLVLFFFFFSKATNAIDTTRLRSHADNGGYASGEG